MKLLGNRPWILASLVILGGCATVSKRDTLDPRETLRAICSYGKKNQSVSGNVWMKVASSESSGQFPAFVKAAEGSVDLEVTNPLGGTEAQIQIRGHSFEIKVFGDHPRTDRGVNHWRGIPLEWATALFLGHFPCPQVPIDESMVTWNQDDELVVDLPVVRNQFRERFRFVLTTWRQKPWPEKVFWEQVGPLGNKVEFRFSVPEDTSGESRQLAIDSDKGSVKLRWQKRSATQKSQY